MDFKRDIVETLNAVFRQKRQSKIKKLHLIKENEDLYLEIESYKEIIGHLKKELDATKNEVEKQKKIFYQKGFQTGRQLSMTEENGVQEEVKILKRIQSLLEGDIEPDKVMS